MSLSIWRGAFGPLHLHRDAAAVREHGAVHLADRCGGHRLLLELDEEPRDRLVQVLEDDPLDVRVRERRDVVLEAAELGDDLGRDDVRPRREELPELHERRPELVEHLAQVTPAARPRSPTPARAALRARTRSRGAPRPGRSRPGGRCSPSSSPLAMAQCCTQSASILVSAGRRPGRRRRPGSRRRSSPSSGRRRGTRPPRRRRRP